MSVEQLKGQRIPSGRTVWTKLRGREEFGMWQELKGGQCG